METYEKVLIGVAVTLLVIASLGIYYEFIEPGSICDELGYTALAIYSNGDVICYKNIYQDDEYTIKGVQHKTVNIKAYKDSQDLIDRTCDLKSDIEQFKENSLDCNDQNYIGYTLNNEGIGGKQQLFKCSKTDLETTIYTWNATGNSFDFLLVIIN